MLKREREIEKKIQTKTVSKRERKREGERKWKKRIQKLRRDCTHPTGELSWAKTGVKKLDFKNLIVTINVPDKCVLHLFLFNF
jgi:hypothetical protein